MALIIRNAEKNDVELILAFIQEHALYENEPHAAIINAEALLRDGFGNKPMFHVLIAEWEQQAAGFAFYFFNYSTWQGRPGLFLDDLFIRPQFRSLGIGKALFQRLAHIAEEHHCTRMQWQVLKSNTQAIGFYQNMGAHALEKWGSYRLEKAQIRQIAESTPKLAQ